MSTLSGRSILVILVLAQLAGTSPWFAANAVLPQLVNDGGVGVSTVTAAVQAGFVLGTLVIALTGLADRAAGHRVFGLSCVMVALFNVLPLLVPGSSAALVVARTGVGIGLAGVYPVGMALAARLLTGSLGTALGWLVGALVLGTASAHVLRGVGEEVSAASVLVATSVAAVAGGALVWWCLPVVPTGKCQTVRLTDFVLLWRIADFRRAAVGYFGHMWELYTLWAVIPMVLATRLSPQQVALGSGLFIAVGALGCVVGGLFARRVGSAWVARTALAGGLVCGLLTPVMWNAPTGVWAGWLAVWGVVVAADSPQLSALTALSTPPERVASGLALTTCIGFVLTVVSVLVAGRIDGLWWAVTALSVGPAVGLVGLRGVSR